MLKTMIGAATFAALAMAAPASAEEAKTKQIDVAYKAMSEGRTADALERLAGSKAAKEGDPATLINLGSAYARNGQVEKARDTYRAAMFSDIRYDLELADGSWMDSRQAARQAIDMLNRRTDVAMR